MAHHHLCVECRDQLVACSGTWQRNHDGAPEVICDRYHLPNGELNQECLCLVCDIKRADEEGAAFDWEMSRS